MCPEEDSASVEWARQKGENWVNKDITSLEFVENIFRLMNWNRECRYKVLGRVANSDQGLCMLFDLEEAIMFTPKPQEYRANITLRQYQRLESGERNILTSSFGLACRVIEALDMDVSKFYHGDYYLEEEVKTMRGKGIASRKKSSI